MDLFPVSLLSNTVPRQGRWFGPCWLWEHSHSCGPPSRPNRVVASPQFRHVYSVALFKNGDHEEVVKEIYECFHDELLPESTTKNTSQSSYLGKATVKGQPTQRSSCALSSLYLEYPTMFLLLRSLLQLVLVISRFLFGEDIGQK